MMLEGNAYYSKVIIKDQIRCTYCREVVKAGKIRHREDCPSSSKDKK